KRVCNSLEGAGPSAPRPTVRPPKAPRDRRPPYRQESGYSSLILQPAACQTLDYLPLENKEEDEHRQDRDHGPRHLHVVLVWKSPLEHGDDQWQCELLLVQQVDQRSQEAVPRP